MTVTRTSPSPCSSPPCRSAPRKRGSATCASPSASLGWAELSGADGAAYDYSEGGYSFQVGLRVGVFVALWNHLVLGVQGEYSHLEVAAWDVSGEAFETLELAGDSAAAQVVLGVRF